MGDNLSESSAEMFFMPTYRWLASPAGVVWDPSSAHSGVATVVARPAAKHEAPSTVADTLQGKEDEDPEEDEEEERHLRL